MWLYTKKRGATKQLNQDDLQMREIKNRKNFSVRLNIFFFVAFFVFSILIVKLAILQFVQGPSLAEKQHQLGTRNVKLPPIRGNMSDSTGDPIAYSTSRSRFILRFSRDSSWEAATELAIKLEEVFAKYGDPATAISIDTIVKRMDINTKQNIVSVPRRIKSGLTNDEIAYFSEHRNDYPFIDIVEENVRNYDKDTVAVQLTGYLKKYKGVKESVQRYKDKQDETDPKLVYLDDEEVGMDGLEMMYQEVLRGKNGLKSYPVDNRSNIIGPAQITVPERGDDLYLTINKNVQLVAENAITDQLYALQHSSPGSLMYQGRAATTGYAVAMEVKTGKVIAMASMPDYDPNVWAGGSISSENWDKLQYYLGNGAIKQVYPPYDDPKEQRRHPSSLVPLGSTQKPLTVLIGLNEKFFTPSTIYRDTGVFSFGKKGHEVNIRNSLNHVYGSIDPAGAIAHSSNPFMTEMVGNKLYLKYGSEGVKVWDNYVKQFGLGVLTESGLPGESEGVVDYFHEAKSGSSQSALIFSSFGQQGRYTALQLSQYAATTGCKGNRIQPQFVNEMERTLQARLFNPTSLKY